MPDVFLPASPVKPEESLLVKGLVICGWGGGRQNSSLLSPASVLGTCSYHDEVKGFGGFEPRLYLSDDTEMQIRGELDFI